MAAGIILGGGVTTGMVMPQTTYAALGDTAEVYHPEDNPGKATITISQRTQRITLHTFQVTSANTLKGTLTKARQVSGSIMLMVTDRKKEFTIL